MSGCCDEFSLAEYVESFDMGINFLLGPPTPSEVIFIPSVDADGNLSWSNNGGLPNPPTVNIKGPQNPDAFNLMQGIEIPANANLNDYNTPGTYYCPDAARAATIANGPTTGVGYKLVVMRITTNTNNYLRQTAYFNNAYHVYIRYSVGGAWTANGWKYLINSGMLPLSLPGGGTGASDAAGARANLGVNLTKKGLVAAAIASNSVQVTHVEFDAPFSTSSVQVVACLGAAFVSTAQAYMANVSVSVANITESGFDIYIGYNGTTSNTGVSIRWIAVGT